MSDNDSDIFLNSCLTLIFNNCKIGPYLEIMVMDLISSAMSQRNHLAEEMHRQALALRKTVLGKEHPSTLTSSQGRYEEADW